MIYTYRKQLIAAFIVILLIIGGIITYTVLQSKKDTAKKAPAVTTSKTIQGLDDKKDFPLPDTTIQMVESYINSAMTAKHKNSTYTAKVRSGSYNQTVTPEGGTITSLLVDVMPFKETYSFYRTSGSDPQFSTSSLRCAPEAQQIVHPSVCKDLSND
jgi:hypothetical protein